jgi:hypothetical protein
MPTGSKRNDGKAMKACLLFGCLLLLIGGCSLANSYLVQDRLSRVPRVTCDQLARNGPPADGQVTLTDLQPCGRGFVASRSGESGDLDLYIPAYSARLAIEPNPPDLAFLLQIWNDDDRRRLLDHPGPVEGTCWVHKGARVVEVSRGPGQIEEWARNGLQEKYPGIRLAEVWVLTFGHGSTPTAERVTSARWYGITELLIGAVVLALGGILAWRRVAKPAAPLRSALPESED